MRIYVELPLPFFLGTEGVAIRLDAAQPLFGGDVLVGDRIMEVGAAAAKQADPEQQGNQKVNSHNKVLSGV